MALDDLLSLSQQSLLQQLLKTTTAIDTPGAKLASKNKFGVDERRLVIAHDRVKQFFALS